MKFGAGLGGWIRLEGCWKAFGSRIYLSLQWIIASRNERDELKK